MPERRRYDVAPSSEFVAKKRRLADSDGQASASVSPRSGLTIPLSSGHNSLFADDILPDIRFWIEARHIDPGVLRRERFRDYAFSKNAGADSAAG
jgi:hypothetical protein